MPQMENSNRPKGMVPITQRQIERLFPKASKDVIALNANQKPQFERGKIMVSLNANDVYAVYLKTGSVHRTGEAFGISGDTVHQVLLRNGKKLKNSNWTAMELNELREAYTDPANVNLAILCNKLGRTYAAVACKADELGISGERGKRKRTETQNKANSERMKLKWVAQPHPKGMLGKKHSQATKDVISEKGMGRPKAPESLLKMLKTKYAKYGRIAPTQARGSWKAAWREIGGKRFFARSRWEANYARFLQFNKDAGLILEWEHEPETFWFEKIKRGVRSYLPDFKVTFTNGSVEFHEVKGWMDGRSKTKIKRMAKYHPQVVLRVIDKTWFRENSKKLSAIIKDWEAQR